MTGAAGIVATRTIFDTRMGQPDAAQRPGLYPNDYYRARREALSRLLFRGPEVGGQAFQIAAFDFDVGIRAAVARALAAVVTDFHFASFAIQVSGTSNGGKVLNYPHVVKVLHYRLHCFGSVAAGKF